MMQARLKEFSFQHVDEDGSAESVLLRLQLEQLEHDEKYHREISRLTMHHRINHLALHFAKYAGQLAEAGVNPQRIEWLVTDIFIIATSCSNILNIRMMDQFDPSMRSANGTLSELGQRLRTSANPSPADLESLLRWTIISTGRMAAACEKLDHIEDYPFRRIITQSVMDIAKGPLVFASSNGWDLAAMVRARLQGVKEKSALYGHI